ncbi:MAG: cohesin domain-containing protein [Candidatus Promineifilaceae bacterium]|jgi:hypothetical protein
MKKPNSKVWVTLLVLTFSLIVVMLVGSAAAEDEAIATLALDPAGPVVMSVGMSSDMDITLTDATNVYGAQLALSFDPNIIQVSGGQLTPGTCPQPDFLQSNVANNATGVINYVVSQLNPTAPCTGGVVATITFECVAEGQSAVTFTNSIISDPNATAIPHTPVGSSVVCEQAAFQVTGTVALQAWPDPSGVQVWLFDSFGHVDGPVEVGSDGTFTLVANDAAETYRVVAEYDRYLSAEATDITGTNGTTVNLGLTTLRAGDINGDGVINILDLTALGGNFNKTSPQVWAP